MIILWIALGFGLGFLTAFCWQQHRWKKAEEAWTRKQRQRQKNMERELSLAKDRASAAEQATQVLSQKNRKMQGQRKREQVRPEKNPKGQLPPETVDVEEKPDIRETFRAVGTLNLRFQYQLPDSLILQPGEGYLRNDQNELIPGPETFSGVNTASGYAMDGLFYLFNVVYRGKEYTFQQIMDGEMGNGYIRIQAVLEPAKIATVGSAGYYALAARGRLHAADMG